MTAAVRYMGSVGALGGIIDSPTYVHPGDGGSRLYLALPVDACVGPNGLFYAVTRMDSLFRGSVKRHGLDTEPKEFKYTSGRIFNENDELLGAFGPEGTKDGEFIWPVCIAADAAGHIYVTDEARHDVQVFSADGRFLRRWGTQGSGAGQLSGPAGIAVTTSGEVVVVDSLGNRVQRFTSGGKLVAAIGAGSGAAPGQFDRPWGVAVTRSGDIYVADWGNDRVQWFGPDGALRGVVGKPGSGPGELRRPSGVAVDEAGRVYVADRGNNRVQVFDENGRHLQMLLGDGRLTRSGAQWYAEHTFRRDQRAEHAEYIDEHERTFREPTSVKIDSRGRVLVVDTGRHRIQIYGGAMMK